MADSTSLGDRMKLYEEVTRAFLPRRTYTVVRVDGRAFHSYLRDAERPFDMNFVHYMGEVAAVLCKEMAGSVFAYQQSDEISILLTDFNSVHTEPWFGGSVQKIASVAASLATAALNDLRPGRVATFDARVFTLPSAVEAANYFVWRQRDATRNSISMAAQAAFSHASLQGLNRNQMQEKLWSERGINWNDYPAEVKRGTVCVQVEHVGDVGYQHKGTGELVVQRGVRRTRWDVVAAPYFVAHPDTWLAQRIPSLPTLDHDQGPIVTRSGRVLTDSDLQALADEAERGYDLLPADDRKLSTEEVAEFKQRLDTSLHEGSSDEAG